MKCAEYYPKNLFALFESLFAFFVSLFFVGHAICISRVPICIFKCPFTVSKSTLDEAQLLKAPVITVLRLCIHLLNK